jgi:EPS-associated MarR family transcriptional regulator
MSLGKVNYCVRALIGKEWVKAAHFKNSRNKAAYVYLLTPRWLKQKADLTLRFLQARVREYETLRVEIEQIAQRSSAPRSALSKA